MTKEEIILANKEFLFPAVFHYFKEPLVIARAKNQYVWDADGNQYLDFLGGIVTVSVGHCNDQVNAKVHKQLDTLQHVSTVFANAPQVPLAKKIASITPGGKLTKSSFTNSGTEANETALLPKSTSGAVKRWCDSTAAFAAATKCKPGGDAPAARGAASSSGASRPIS